MEERAKAVESFLVVYIPGRSQIADLIISMMGVQRWNDETALHLLNITARTATCPLQFLSSMPWYMRHHGFGPDDGFGLKGTIYFSSGKIEGLFTLNRKQDIVVGGHYDFAARKVAVTLTRKTYTMVHLPRNRKRWATRWVRCSAIPPADDGVLSFACDLEISPSGVVLKADPFVATKLFHYLDSVECYA